MSSTIGKYAAFDCLCLEHLPKNVQHHASTLLFNDIVNIHDIELFQKPMKAVSGSVKKTRFCQSWMGKGQQWITNAFILTKLLAIDVIYAFQGRRGRSTSASFQVQLCSSTLKRLVVFVNTLSS